MVHVREIERPPETDEEDLGDRGSEREYSS